MLYMLVWEKHPDGVVFALCSVQCCLALHQADDKDTAIGNVLVQLEAPSIIKNTSDALTGS